LSFIAIGTCSGENLLMGPVNEPTKRISGNIAEAHGEPAIVSGPTSHSEKLHHLLGIG
jgi:hypothetical protein